jgi:ribosomal protein S6
MLRFRTVLTLRATATAAFHSLTNLVKDISHKVVESGGIVRSIQNHGIRDLPHRFRAKFPDKEGNRYYQKGRFVSIYYDASPAVMRQVEQSIRLNDEVLRNTHLKARNKLWYVNIAREDKNPYIQRVVEMEEAAEAAGTADQTSMNSAS